MERLDKILSNQGYGSRKEVKALVKNGVVVVDGVVVKDSGMQIDPEKSNLEVNGEILNYRKFIYLLMNKPTGVVSATFDKKDTTVIDLLTPDYQIFNPFPVGRLDKDTVGLLLITNDGELNHKVTGPKFHVDKVYYARIDKRVNQEDIIAFKNGVTIDDDYKCMSAGLEIIKASDEDSEVYITIREGKFHQVKRMFQALDKEVTYLKRIKFGPLTLDDSMKEGEFRELTNEELESLKR